jgi:hypothetical protein
MGLTIHYNLRLDAHIPDEARQVVDHLRQAALDLPMPEVGEVAEFSEAGCDFRAADLFMKSLTA